MNQRNDTPPEWTLDGGAGPALPQSEKAADALVQTALDRHFAAASTRRAFPMWQVAAALALVALTVTGASAALKIWGRSEPEVASTAAPAPTPAARPRPAVRPVVEPMPSEAEPEPATTAPSAARPARPEAAQDLLNRANELRGQREFRRAYRVYGKAISLSPEGQTAYVARVASASLALEQLSQPGRALELYRAALAQRPNGVLAEEARFGVAECLRSLGRRDAERDALEAFLQAHPHSGLSARAQQRLAELR